MEQLPELALENIWCFLPSETLLGILPTCRRWRYSIISYLERSGLELRTEHWRFDGIDRYQFASKLYSWGVMLRSILPLMPNLRELCISDMEYPLTWTLSDLRELGMSDTENRPYTEIIDISIAYNNCRFLEYIDLCGFRVKHYSVKRLFEQCPRLKELSVPAHIDPGSRYALFCSLPAISTLYIGCFELSDGEVAMLPASLERLSCHKVTPALADRVNNSLPKLRVLIARSDSDQVLDLSKSSSLTFANLPYGEYHPAPVLPAGIQYISQRLDKRQFESVHVLYPHLRTLIIGDVFAAGAPRALTKLPHLQQLVLMDIDITPELADLLPLLTNLKQLGLYFRNLQPAVKDVARLGEGVRDLEPFDVGWALVLKLAAHVQYLLVAAEDVGSNPLSPDALALSEEQFRDAGYRVPEGRRITLYTYFRTANGHAVEQLPWCYNLHNAGRLRVKSLSEWYCDFPEQTEKGFPQ